MLAKTLESSGGEFVVMSTWRSGGPSEYTYEPYKPFSEPQLSHLLAYLPSLPDPPSRVSEGTLQKVLVRHSQDPDY